MTTRKKDKINANANMHSKELEIERSIFRGINKKKTHSLTSFKRLKMLQCSLKL